MIPVSKRVTLSSVALCSMFALSLVAAGCGGSGGGGSDGDSNSDSGDNTNTDTGSSSDGSGLSTLCGVVSDGSARNPIKLDRGIPVTLAATLDSNEVILTNSAGQQFLVKPQGLGNTRGFKNTASSTLYAELAAEQLYFFSAGDNCTAQLFTGTGQVGQIVTASGKSFSEELIAKKYAGVIETSGACGEEVLAPCFQAIADSHEHHVYGDPRACSGMPSDIRYNPADASCAGNASLRITGELSDAFSIQLRYPDGTDRIIETCEDPSCTPLKVQAYNRGDELLACFGAPGNSVALSDVNHVSIKREPDDHEPPRYCIPNPAAAIN